MEGKRARGRPKKSETDPITKVSIIFCKSTRGLPPLCRKCEAHIKKGEHYVCYYLEKTVQLNYRKLMKYHLPCLEVSESMGRVEFVNNKIEDSSSDRQNVQEFLERFDTAQEGAENREENMHEDDNENENIADGTSERPQEPQNVSEEENISGEERNVITVIQESLKIELKVPVLERFKNYLMTKGHADVQKISDETQTEIHISKVYEFLIIFGKKENVYEAEKRISNIRNELAEKYLETLIEKPEEMVAENRALEEINDVAPENINNINKDKDDTGTRDNAEITKKATTKNIFIHLCTITLLWVKILAGLVKYCITEVVKTIKARANIENLQPAHDKVPAETSSCRPASPAPVVTQLPMEDSEKRETEFIDVEEEAKKRGLKIIPMIFIDDVDDDDENSLSEDELFQILKNVNLPDSEDYSSDIFNSFW